MLINSILPKNVYRQEVKVNCLLHCNKATLLPFWTESDYQTPVKRPPTKCCTKVKLNYFYSIVIFYRNDLYWTIKYYTYNKHFQSKMAGVSVVKKTKKTPEFCLFASILFDITAFYCWCTEQPSWILRSGVGETFGLRGAFQLKFQTGNL